MFHEESLVSLPGVDTNLIATDADGDQEVWLRIPRLQKVPPPEPTPELEPWVSIPNNPTKEPQLKSEITQVIDGEQELLALADHPEITQGFELYLNDSWQPWSNEESPRRQTIETYDRFFALHQDTQTGGDSEDGIELCVGIGMGIWNHPDTESGISYPLILKNVEIRLDTQSMNLDVVPTDREPNTWLEPYFELDIPATTSVEESAARIFEHSDTTISPFDTSSFEEILRSAASRLDTGGRFWPDVNPDSNDRSLPKSNASLLVTDTWVIFARPRGTDIITADVIRLKNSVADGAILPEAAELIVTEPPDTVLNRPKTDYRGISNPGVVESNTEHPIQDLYFPKPFNEAQVTIVDRLEYAPGVVVQGPPGTGKTHTIANVICHYLANGKRVLVTAQHDAPLTVLRDQLPEQLRELAISLLTSEREGLRQVENSVKKISGEINRLEPAALERDIALLEERIEQLHSLLAANEANTRAAIDPQASPITLDAEEVQPMELARRCLHGSDEFGWFVDRPTERDPTFESELIERTRELRRKLGKRLIYVNEELVDPGGLPSPHEIQDIHEKLLARREIQSTIDSGSLVALISATPDRVESLRTFLNFSRMAIERVALCEEGWLQKVRQGVARKDDLLVTKLSELANEIEPLNDQRTEFLAQGLIFPTEALQDVGVQVAVSKASDGKRPFGLLSRSAGSKELFAQIRINGKEPENEDEWAVAQSYVDLYSETSSLMDRWNQLASEIGGPQVTGAWPENLRALDDHARNLLSVQDLTNNVLPELSHYVSTYVREGDVSIYDDPEQAQLLCKSLQTHIDKIELVNATESQAKLNETFSELRGPVYIQALKFCERHLGQPQHSSEKVGVYWSKVVQETTAIYGMREDIAALRQAGEQISESGAPNWSLMLTSSPAEESDSLTPVNWLEAWHWGWANEYLEKIDAQNELRALAVKHQELEQQLAQAIESLVEQRTWLKLKGRLTQRIQASLSAYLTAMTKIGKGTGIRAISHRRDARQAMSNAQGAVPVWIMPHYRVSESLPPELGIFDLVIIDEASQSDIAAIPAICRAKKILIVGDDKQVSPSDVGVKQSDIDLMRDRFLKELPYGQHFLPGASIYDLGSTMFASDIIRLREHFRSVEPIIQFSNRFYGNEMQVLRIAKPSERLNPPLIDVHVKGGFRAGRGMLNKPEAEAIVDEVIEITNTPGMETRSIGIVSLLGAEQGKYIQGRLIDELGETVFLRHKIRCGDAMHFQGKEADIVLVSLVAAGDRIQTATSRTYEQRFNVACSRARDRMYVFHSFTRDQLKEEDLKARLLDHLANPVPIDCPETQDLRSLCESGFEEDVFDELVSRGYRVTPQVRSSNFRIDLVVEGQNDARLAVECDGDQYHGPDKWMDDYHRQRILERLGWKFWRCLGSTWIRKKDECVQDLLETLESMGIKPHQGEPVDSRYVEYRVIEPEDVQSESLEAVEPAPKDEEEGVSDSVSTEATLEPGQTSIPTLENDDNLQSPLTRNNADSQNKIEVGDEITYVEDGSPNEIRRARIVSGVSDPKHGTINQGTPVARALLGATEGDVVSVALPTGSTRYEIRSITKI